MALSGLLGATLVNKRREEVKTTTAVSKKDIVLVYFSAHWCPPCRAFTPTLSDFYSQSVAAGKKVSVIFASQDSKEEDYRAYFASMSFDFAFPFGDARIRSLMDKWEVRGLPTLVVLDGLTGHLLSVDGRAEVTAHKLGVYDMWNHKRGAPTPSSIAASATTTTATNVATSSAIAVAAAASDTTTAKGGHQRATLKSRATAASAAPKSRASAVENKRLGDSSNTLALSKIVGSTFISPDQSRLDSAVLDADILCVYFSAHWCTPCREFTPRLSRFYTALKASGKSVALLFASRDHDEKCFAGYHASMACSGAFPFGDARIASLTAKWRIVGIPTLVVLSRSGKVIRADGRGDVDRDGVRAYDSWLAEM